MRDIGRRILVTGNTAAGKSTLAARLAANLGVPLVELDALNWLPGWVGLHETDPAELERRMREATAGEGWVVAGSYTGIAQRAFWPRLDTIVWLDPPVHRLVWRVLLRSWNRWRTSEPLWGGNRERFWPQLMVWSPRQSMVAWIVTQARRKRRYLAQCRAAPAWSHIRFVRLTSAREVGSFLAELRSNPDQRTTRTGIWTSK